MPPHAPLCGLMIRSVCRSKNRLTGIHFAELIYNKMSDTEEVVDEEVQYVMIFQPFLHHSSISLVERQNNKCIITTVCLFLLSFLLLCFCWREEEGKNIASTCVFKYIYKDFTLLIIHVTDHQHKRRQQVRQNNPLTPFLPPPPWKDLTRTQ